MPIIEVPAIEKLPETLYGGLFKHINHDLYMFQYSPWFFNSPHALGWSREILYLHSSDSECPCKLVGDAFQKIPRISKFDGKYRSFYAIENTTEPVAFEQLHRWATEAISGLENADVHIDAWGCKNLSEWNSDSMQDWHNKRAIETYIKGLEGRKRGIRN